MVIKVYVSGISGSKEVKKRQQRALLLLDSAHVEYERVDITEPGREQEKDKVVQLCKEKNDNADHVPLPPQFFNDDQYCGDYDDFNSAVDVDKLHHFLKLDDNAQLNHNPPSIVVDDVPGNDENLDENTLTTDNQPPDEVLDNDEQLLGEIQEAY